MPIDIYYLHLSHYARGRYLTPILLTANVTTLLLTTYDTMSGADPGSRNINMEEGRGRVMCKFSNSNNRIGSGQLLRLSKIPKMACVMRQYSKTL